MQSHEHQEAETIVCLPCLNAPPTETSLSHKEPAMFC